MRLTGTWVRLRVSTAAAAAASIALAWGFVGYAAPAEAPTAPTFTRDIAPILQRSCQNCHRPDGVAPMSLVTYEEVRPFARAIKQRTAIGPHRGVMPPWYIEKNVGIQKFKNDPSLSDAEIAAIGRWVDSGAPQGNPADLPTARRFDDQNSWAIGTPDLIVSAKEIFVKADAPDWWGEIDPVPTGLTEDRYVAALQIREINDVPSKDASGRVTVGGRYVIHHMIWGTDQGGGGGTNTPWPVHEVGRGADFFPPEGGRLLKAGEKVVTDSVHLHSNGRDTTAHLEIGFKLYPKGYQPTVKPSLSRALGNGVDISIRPNEANQQLHAYTVLQEHTKITSFEPHLHAPGARMCLEAIWGFNIQTLSCAGYDHNWVRGYDYADDATPLLPKGTILHIIGYMDNSPANRNVPDPRNWQGSGNRSVANMFLDLGQGLALSDEQFKEEMIKRRQVSQEDVIIGCPLCNTVQVPKSSSNQQQ
jgi:mono/diheme cytochrome c family protein